MLKIAGKLILALFLLGGMAVLSARTTLEQNITEVQQQWERLDARDQAQPENLQRLLDRVAALRQRHPERQELLVLEYMIGSRLAGNGVATLAETDFTPET